MPTTEQRFTDDRRAIVERLFLKGIPSLWCPPLTHFDEDGRIDRPRHLSALITDVRGDEIHAAEAFSRSLSGLFADLLDRGGKVGFENP